MGLVPETWRSQEIRIVSAELSAEIVRLRRVADAAGAPEGSLTSIWLDQHHPSWRDELPVGVSSEAGRALIDGLMKTYIEYPPRKLQSESYTGPITISAFQRLQAVREQLAKEGVTIGLPTGN